MRIQNDEVIIDLLCGEKYKAKALAILDLAYNVNKYIDDKFKKEYPDKYKQWHGNHCLQTSIMLSGILDGIEDLHPKVVYCLMKDKAKDGREIVYNHAYVSLFDSHKHNLFNMIIDMARNDRKKLFICGSKYMIDDLYLEKCKEEGYEHISIGGVVYVDFMKALLFETEYFTGQPSHYLMNEIKKHFKEKIEALKAMEV